MVHSLLNAQDANARRRYQMTVAMVTARKMSRARAQSVDGRPGCTDGAAGRGFMAKAQEEMTTNTQQVKTTLLAKFMSVSPWG
jgi:hypothetical protein